MSQQAFLREMDAAAFSAFFEAGLADDALYTAPGAGQPTACRVLIDRGVREFGDDAAPVSTRWVRVTFQRAEIEPQRGGRLEVGGETFDLDAELDSDESTVRWVVVRE